MIADKVKKLSEISYPAETKFPLLNGKKAVIGAINFEVVELIENKWGSIDRIQELLTGDNVKVSNVVEIIWMMTFNKDDFNSIDDFKKHVPLSAAPNLMNLIWFYMFQSMPQVEGSGDDDEEVSEKK